MLVPLDELLLDVSVQLHEVRVVARDAYEEIPVAFGVRHRVAQRARVDHVELHLHAAEIEVRRDVGLHAIEDGLVAVVGPGDDLDVEGDVVGHPLGVQAGHGDELVGQRRRRQVGGREPRREGLAAPPAARQGAGEGPEGDVVRHAPVARHVAAAAVVVGGLQRVVDDRHDVARQAARQLVVLPEAGHATEDARAERLVALEVGGQGLEQRPEVHDPLGEDQRLDDRQAVDDVGQPHHRHAGAVVDRAARREIAPLVHRPGEQRRQERRGLELLVGAAEAVVGVHRHPDQPPELRRVGLEEGLVALEGARVAGPWPDLLAEDRMDAVVQRHLQGRHEVEHDAAGVAVVPAAARGLDAAGGAPVAGIGEGEALLEERRDHRVVAMERRRGARQQVHLAQAPQVGLRVHAGGVAGVHVRVAQAQHLGGLEEDPGQIADRAGAVRRHAAERDDLIGRRAAEEPVAEVRHHREVVGQLQHQAADQLKGLRDAAPPLDRIGDAGHVALEVGIEPGVEAAHREAGVDALLVLGQEEQPDGLDRLAQRLGGLRRHLAAGGGDGAEALGAGHVSGSPALAGADLCLLGQAPGVVDEALDGHAQRPVEGGALGIGGGLGLATRRLGPDVGQAAAQDLRDVGDRVGDGLGLPLEVEDEAVVELERARVAVPPLGEVADVVLHPEGEDLPVQDGDVLVADAVGVQLAGLHRQELGPDAGAPTLGVDDDAHAAAGGGPREEVVVAHDGALVEEDVAHRLGLTQDGRLLRPGQEAARTEGVLGEQPRPLGADLGLDGAVRPQQPLDGREVVQRDVGQVGIGRQVPDLAGRHVTARLAGGRGGQVLPALGAAPPRALGRRHLARAAERDGRRHLAELEEVGQVALEDDVVRQQHLERVGARLEEGAQGSRVAEADDHVGPLDDAPTDPHPTAREERVDGHPLVAGHEEEARLEDERGARRVPIAQVVPQRPPMAEHQRHGRQLGPHQPGRTGRLQRRAPRNEVASPGQDSAARRRLLHAARIGRRPRNR